MPLSGVWNATPTKVWTLWSSAFRRAATSSEQPSQEKNWAFTWSSDMYWEGIHKAYKHIKTSQPICSKLAKTAPLDCLVYGVLGQNLRCKSARHSQRNEMCLQNVALSPVLKVSAKGYVAARVISRLPMKGTARSWPKACKTKLLS